MMDMYRCYGYALCIGRELSDYKEQIIIGTDSQAKTAADELREDGKRIFCDWEVYEPNVPHQPKPVPAFEVTGYEYCDAQTGEFVNPTVVVCETEDEADELVINMRDDNLLVPNPPVEIELMA